MTPAPAGLSASSRDAWTALFGPPIAHRGLWSADAPENGVTAVTRAVEAGFGVEFDVRLSADGVPHVFHDADLGRMTGEAGPLSLRKASDLSQLRLAGLDPIPTLADALQAVDGRALALVELKPDGDAERLVERALDVIGHYCGPVAIIAFDPTVHAAIARASPSTLRGVHIAADDPDAQAAAEARAHFILPARDAMQSPATCALRAAGAPAVAWTIRSPGEQAHARGWADNIIFEGFAP